MTEPAPPAPSAVPTARVRGEPLTELPEDLYIPPEALRVVLEAFEGPLDLLLYLIRRQNLDILDIPVAIITAQYLEYIRLMDSLRLELAGEYLVMAAWLAEIKSRMLLPKSVEEEGEDLETREVEAERRQCGVDPTGQDLMRPGDRGGGGHRVDGHPTGASPVGRRLVDRIEIQCHRAVA